MHLEASFAATTLLRELTAHYKTHAPVIRLVDHEKLAALKEQNPQPNERGEVPLKTESAEIFGKVDSVQPLAPSTAGASLQSKTC